MTSIIYDYCAIAQAMKGDDWLTLQECNIVTDDHAAPDLEAVQAIYTITHEDYVQQRNQWLVKAERIRRGDGG